MRTVHCDRCGEACTDRPVVTLERRNGQVERLPVVIDLCTGCAIDLATWLRTEVTAPLEPAGTAST